MELNKDVMTAITLTFTVVILAWLLLNYQAVTNIANGAASAYSTSVSAIMPKAA